jgi:hypothetical protein
MPFYSERLSFRGRYNSEARAHVLERALPKATKDFQVAIGAPRPAG